MGAHAPRLLREREVARALVRGTEVNAPALHASLGFAPGRRRLSLTRTPDDRPICDQSIA
ncbi:MAG TPA: hypothetical protein VFN57_11835 [Thermomicrobiaceae bacterium]|nr:hypothetical protein [Thermomicrobiaceae bacterium]